MMIDWFVALLFFLMLIFLILFVVLGVYVTLVMLLMIGLSIPECLFNTLEMVLDCYFVPICCNPEYYCCPRYFSRRVSPPQCDSMCQSGPVIILNPFNLTPQLGLEGKQMCDNV